MIEYKSDLFGLKTLLVWNGSPLYRASFPAVLSTGILLIYNYTWIENRVDDTVEEIGSPNVVSLFIGLFAFLLVRRIILWKMDAIVRKSMAYKL